MRTAIEYLRDAVRTTTPHQRSNAQLFHSAIEFHLRLHGWKVVREFVVSDRGDGVRGRIDLAVLRPRRIAIELDNVRIRDKSRYKLGQFKGFKFVILRASGEVIALQEP